MNWLEAQAGGTVSLGRIASGYSTMKFLYQRLGFVPEVMYIRVRG